MKDFIWKASKRAMTTKELFDYGRVFYIPESVVPKLCKISSFEKDPTKVDRHLKIKMVTKHVVTRKEHRGFVVEEGAEFIIPFYYLYLSVNNCGYSPELVVYKSVSLENGNFVFVPGAEETTENLKAWSDKVSDLAETVAAEMEESSNKEKYENTTFDAEVEDTVYVGKTLDITVSEDMTVAEFKAEVKNVLGIVPCIFQYQKKVKDANAPLKSIGVKGNTVVKVGPYFEIGDVNDLLQEQLQLEKVAFYFKYINRPWAYIMVDEPLSSVHRLPSVWRSIQVSIFIRIVNLIDVDKLD